MNILQKKKKQKPFRERLIFIPQGNLYISWKVIIVILSTIELLVYPFIAAFGVSNDHNNMVTFVLDVLTLVFVIDIILNFFKAVRKDDMQFIKEHLVIVETYLRGGFFLDLLITIPWGSIFSKYDEKLIILNLIKVLRVIAILDFFSPKFLNLKIRGYYFIKLEKVLKNYEKANDKMECNNFIMERLRTQNQIHFLRSILILFVVVYLIGVTFFIMSNIILKAMTNEGENFVSRNKID